MKESEELLKILSSIDNMDDVYKLQIQVDEFERYISNNNVCIKKRQLIISQEDKFLYGGSLYSNIKNSNI